jgi:hypothetical protein
MVRAAVPGPYADDLTHRTGRTLLVRPTKRAWRDIVKRYMIEEAMIDPVVTLVCTDNWIEFTVRYITDYKLRRTTKNRLFGLILDEFEATGGRVKIASTTVQIVEPPPLTVKLNGN